jgi:hypothetical protein
LPRVAAFVKVTLQLTRFFLGLRNCPSIQTANSLPDSLLLIAALKYIRRLASGCQSKPQPRRGHIP